MLPATSAVISEQYPRQQVHRRHMRTRLSAHGQRSEGLTLHHKLLKPLNGIIKVQVSEVTSVWFNGTMLLSLQRKVGEFKRCSRISRSGERQKICWVVAIKIRGNIFCSGELGGLCCRWNAYHQNLDRTDEMKYLPGAWIWKTFHYCIIRRSEATWGLLFMSRYRSKKCVGTVCVLKFRSA